MSSNTLEEVVPMATAQIIAAYLQHRQTNTVIKEDQLLKLIEDVSEALKKPHER